MLEQALKDIGNLSDEQKLDLVKQANESKDDIEGNTEIVYPAEDEKLMETIKAMSPKELFDRNVAANIRCCYQLEPILSNMSGRNLKRLLMAVLQLPEEGANLQFGGTREAKQQANYAFALAQQAFNSKIYVTSVKAVTQAKLAKKQEELASNSEQPQGA
jgi:hypothetical protein